MEVCKSPISEPIQYYRNKPRRVYRAKLENENVLVKETEVDELNKEALRTKAAISMIGNKIRVPNLICKDDARNRLVFEFIPEAISLDLKIEQLCMERKFSQLDAILEQLATTLVRMHETPNTLPTCDLNLNRNFGCIGKILDRDVSAIEKEFSGRVEQLEKAKAFAMKNINENDNVLSHGDFKPNNVLIYGTSKIAVVDWIEFGIAVRQLDLGSVILFLAESQRHYFLDNYLRKMGLEMKCENLEKTSLVIAGIIHCAGVLNLCRNFGDSFDNWCRLKADTFNRFERVLNSF